MYGPPVLPDATWWRNARVPLNDAGRPDNHDGDTVTVELDLGFRLTATYPLRVLGCYAPELRFPNGTANPAGLAAQAWVQDWLTGHALHGRLLRERAWPFRVSFAGWDKYAPRFDGVLLCRRNHCLNDDLLASGHAVTEAVWKEQQQV